MEITPNIRTVALIVIGLSYLFMGAAIFSGIEKENEVVERKRLFEEEKIIKTRYNLSDVDYKNLTKFIRSLEPHRSGVQWEFAGALYFAITVITTIGYGHSVPRTSGGKIFCMAYSVIGIPLCLVMFQAMGERINNAAKYSLKKIGRKLGFQLKEVSHTSLVPVGIFSCCLTVAVGCFSFHYFENWPLLDSLYYCVITLTTIGFGDYVALQTESNLQFKPSYVAFSFIYIMVGLTVIGAFLNLVVLRLMVTTPDDTDSTKGEENGEEVNNNTDVESNPRTQSQNHNNSTQHVMLNNNNNIHEEIDTWDTHSWMDKKKQNYGKLSGLPCVSNLYQELEQRNLESRSHKDQQTIMDYSNHSDCKQCQYSIPISLLCNEATACHCKTCTIIKKLQLKSHGSYKSGDSERLTVKRRSTDLTPNTPLSDITLQEIDPKNVSCIKTRRFSKSDYPSTDAFKHFKFDPGIRMNVLEPLHVMSSNSLLSMGSNSSMNDCIDNNLVRHLSVDSGYCGHSDKPKPHDSGFPTVQRPSMLNLAKIANCSSKTTPGSFPVSSLLNPEGNLSLPNRIQDSSVLFPSVTLSRKAEILAQGIVVQSKTNDMDTSVFPSITVTPCSPIQTVNHNKPDFYADSLAHNVRDKFVRKQSIENCPMDIGEVDVNVEMEINDIPTTKICANGTVTPESKSFAQTDSPERNQFTKSNVYQPTNMKNDQEICLTELNNEQKCKVNKKVPVPR